jgi:hypothetical protein
MFFMDVIPDKRRLIDLVKDASDGRIVLPQFQRNFVWKRSDIEDLIISVLKGYFIGSFLILRTDPEDTPFATRLITGAESVENGVHPEWMILDGQQRLTSLHYAFTAPDTPLKGAKNPFKFFLLLDKIEEGDIDNAVVSKRADRCEKEMQPEYQFVNRVLPLTQIDDWRDWLYAYREFLFDTHGGDVFNDDFKKQLKTSETQWNKVIERLPQFLVPLIELPKISANDHKKLGEVCTIFEKMNSTGVNLSVYDLLTARLATSNIDMHHLWEKAIEKYDRLSEISEGRPDSYGVYTLRVISMMRGQEVRSKTLVNLSPNNFERDWFTATEYMEKALSRIASANNEGFGGVESKWMPYSTMASTLAALLWYIDTHQLDYRAYKKVKKWYWGTIFLERYGGAVESTMDADYRQLVQSFHNNEVIPRCLAEFDNRVVDSETFSFRNVSKLNSIYKGVISLVVLQGAKDFKTGDSVEFYRLNDHHIFPKAFLEAKGYKSNEINTVLNRTLISRETNQSIRDKSPSDYLESVLPEDTYMRRTVLESHFIHEDAMDAMRLNDYELFLERREQAILRTIRKQVQS